MHPVTMDEMHIGVREESVPKKTIISVTTRYKVCAEDKLLLAGVLSRITGKRATGKVSIGLSQGGMFDLELTEVGETLTIP